MQMSGSNHGPSGQLLKILRQPTTGFVLPLRAHQATECAAPGRLMFQLLRYARYMYIRNGLLIRLLKTLRQPTTGFALLGAHQVGAVPEFPSTLCST
ncbi:hypothetical protein CSKR_107433 [Clonorchis sinensis]|uniref:Uncharacterized protein n=1 Tax=Clonorchis sinensis TaxID=79923 RepID=A0A3R7D1T3_CLOSI|nr:hypothetical protein CSKR_107433 [Clonorchis sinensis]